MGGAVGTKVSDEVKEVVLNQKKRYVGRADVVGSWNQTAYDPIFDQSGNVIGIWYTGVPEAPYLEIARKAAVNNIIVTVIIGLVIFIFSYVFIKRKINKPLAEMTLRAKKLPSLNWMTKHSNLKVQTKLLNLGEPLIK